MLPGGQSDALVCSRSCVATQVEAAGYGGEGIKVDWSAASEGHACVGDALEGWVNGRCLPGCRCG